MNDIKLAENIVSHRRQRKITQEQLADFIGVTKASVSKWETGQSYPDIVYLPQLAKYFNISIDELMGYEPQMDKDTIKKVYHSLAEDFVSKPFEEVMASSLSLMKKYYSCYEFLLQLCILWLNHYMLASDPKRQTEILEQIIQLCEHILQECTNFSINKDATTVEALIYIMLQNPDKALHLLGTEIHPYMGNDELIAMAYQMQGNQKMAKKTLQICAFQNMLTYIQTSIKLSALYTDDATKLQEIMRRVHVLNDLFDLDQLHPYTSTHIYITEAMNAAKLADKASTLKFLNKLTHAVHIIYDNPTLHGDDFFDEIGDWLDHLSLGTSIPRNPKLIPKDMISFLQHPAFLFLSEDKEYKKLIDDFMKMIHT